MAPRGTIDKCAARLPVPAFRGCQIPETLFDAPRARSFGVRCASPQLRNPRQDDRSRAVERRCCKGAVMPIRLDARAADFDERFAAFLAARRDAAADVEGVV